MKRGKSSVNAKAPSETRRRRERPPGDSLTGRGDSGESGRLERQDRAAVESVERNRGPLY